MKRGLALPLILLCLGSPTRILFAQDSAKPAAAPAAAPAGDKLSAEQIDQLVAPIALYPDELLSQILMASTYPIEVVQADRWAKAHKDLKGDALAKALESETWDASVKSLVQFPDVLSMMSEKLDITSKIGDAFISQQKDVMDAVQRLRAKAQQAGNLQSNQQQTVTVQPAAAGSQTQTIIIQPANPQVVYVPQYNPTVVYGAWPYPAYPPYPYYPPGYVAGTAALSFGIGVACGAIWSNNAWGSCNWHGGSVNINNNYNRNVNINNANINNANINRANVNNANVNRANVNNAQGTAWKHDPSHRQGAPYSNSATARQYGGVSSTQATQAREQYRGREASGQGLSNRQGGQGNFDRNQASQNMQNRQGQGQNRQGGQGNFDRNQASQNAQNRQGGGQMQNRQSSGNSGAFSGVDRGNATREASSRGNASRSGGQQMSRPSGGSRSTPSRSGGGGRGRR
ncbi:MAG: DUF3300 domain-containing protein [Phycisphaeraceae bacterium]|nr:DUF3300 domain-containing protein [Phycisphaeraceae bacterium]